jgi:hypothetical protein
MKPPVNRASAKKQQPNSNPQSAELKDKQNKDESSGLPLVYVFQEQIQQ